MGVNEVSDSEDEKPIKIKSLSTPKAKALPVIGTIILDDIGDDEIFVVKVPVNVEMDRLHECDLTVRDGNILKFKENVREYVSVIDEEQIDVSLILPDRNGRPSVQAYQIEGCVTLREHIEVPDVPKFVIPPRYIVPAPRGLKTRHPIYGSSRRDLEFPPELPKSPTKRKSEDLEVNNNDETGISPQKKIKIEEVLLHEPSEKVKKKKKKKKDTQEEPKSPTKKIKSEDLEEIKIQEEPSEEKAKKRKKKKKKDKEEEPKSPIKKIKSEDLEEIKIKGEPSEEKAKKHKKKKKKDKEEEAKSPTNKIKSEDLEEIKIKEEPSEDKVKKLKKKKKNKDNV